MIVPARIDYALRLLDPAPSEQVLEFGCGRGVAAGLVCDRLTTGTLLALDRSITAIEHTVRRNAAHVESGRLRAQCAKLDELGSLVAPASLDAAFGVNVNLFWTGTAEPELAALAEALRPGGRLLLCYGAPPPGSTRRVTGVIAASLTAHGFTDVVEHDAPAGSAVSARRRP
ncbi:Methyltransferase domain-containing protein [Pseudonocardia thermophila]|jgi:SAM-dependent methyltransferases|uniref:Methyltransferase domain-containing protein n=1 Tax=Pseudonocardia thermophila TaxID=1848 RepID=A0A1M6PB04_PSETH|nr:class I SAM-dependent methyltransferase [Pseudonocardia thermophila]SHK05126.1 Methyltransferase domain-containing protein [Pseudonocardia thermophila]